MSSIDDAVPINEFTRPLKKIDENMTSIAATLFNAVKEKGDMEVKQITNNKIVYKVSVLLADTWNEYKKHATEQYYICTLTPNVSDVQQMQIFIKIINMYPGEKLSQSAKRQIYILNKLNGHPNSVIYYGSGHFNDVCYIAMEVLERANINTISDAYNFILCYAYISVSLDDNYYCVNSVGVIKDAIKKTKGIINLDHNFLFAKSKSKNNNIKIWNHGYMSSPKYVGDVHATDVDLLWHLISKHKRDEYTSAVIEILKIGKRTNVTYRLTYRQLYASLMHALRRNSECNKFPGYDLPGNHVHYFMCSGEHLQLLSGVVLKTYLPSSDTKHNIPSIITSKTGLTATNAVYVGHAHMPDSLDVYNSVIKMFYISVCFLYNFTNFPHHIFINSEYAIIKNELNINPHTGIKLFLCPSSNDINMSISFINCLLNTVPYTRSKTVDLYFNEQLSDETKSFILKSIQCDYVYVMYYNVSHDHGMSYNRM